MIKKIFANKPSFRTVEFQKGFNVVWADRTKESTKKDSRNGLGKSTLIEIIHFCLGAGANRGKGLLTKPLDGWEFSLILQLADQEIVITRAVNNPGFVHIKGDVSLWPLHGKLQKGCLRYRTKDWNSLLGHLLFGLKIIDEGRKYEPTFRSLISYFVRRGKDAFTIPFEHHRKQKEWDKQINNAFLLGLAWEDAAEIQMLKDRKKGLESFREAAKTGILKGFVGSLGDLEAQKIRLKTQSAQEESELQTFSVHPQYEKVQAEANQLTEEIHQDLNTNSVDKRLVELYERSLKEEQPPEYDSIERLYADAGVAFPEVTLRHIEEVREFHKRIIDNRRSFLANEIERLKREIAKRDQVVQIKTEKRASVMRILRTHGALEEYNLLQTRHMETVNNFNSISTIIENLKTFESRLSDIKIAQEELRQKARQDFDERSNIRERAISYFNTYSERLYNAPGKLVLDVESKGFKFDVEIERSGSSGISNMKVFCYDLVLARLWTERTPSPRLLIHDSTIFDGVDERQRAVALEMAAEESAEHSFQYICMLNSDHVPWNEFSKGFRLKDFIRVTLTDEKEDGCLMGIRF